MSRWSHVYIGEGYATVFEQYIPVCAYVYILTWMRIIRTCLLQQVIQACFASFDIESIYIYMVADID